MSVLIKIGKPYAKRRANGRYQVKRLLGEGGTKKVYLFRYTLLDREVAFALIHPGGDPMASLGS